MRTGSVDPVRCRSGCRGEKGRAGAARSNAKRPRSTGRVGNRRARPVRRASLSLGTGAHPACRPGRGGMTDTPQSWPALSYLETLRPGPDEAVERLKGTVRIVIQRGQIGRASCRERVCQYVSISVVAVSLKKQTKRTTK